jgi:hypothetical protein
VQKNAKAMWTGPAFGTQRQNQPEQHGDLHAKSTVETRRGRQCEGLIIGHMFNSATMKAASKAVLNFAPGQKVHDLRE